MYGGILNFNITVFEHIRRYFCLMSNLQSTSLPGAASPKVVEVVERCARRRGRDGRQRDHNDLNM